MQEDWRRKLILDVKWDDHLSFLINLLVVLLNVSANLALFRHTSIFLPDQHCVVSGQIISKYISTSRTLLLLCIALPLYVLQHKLILTTVVEEGFLGCHFDDD